MKFGITDAFPYIKKEQPYRKEVFMRRLLIVLTGFIFLVGLVSGAMAVGTGKKVEWDEKTQGKVIFDGTAHANAGLKCNDCHTKIFPMKKGDLKMDDMKAGKSCGTCHNGKKAFAVTECAKCHKK